MTQHRWRFAIAVLLLMLADGAVATPRSRPARRIAGFPAVDAIAADTVSRGIPGITIGVSRNAMTYITFAGFSNVTGGVAASDRSIYQVGSITKQFTAAAILRLAEQGLLRTSDDVRRFVPELDTHGRIITLHHLLTHTSGLVDYTSQISNPTLDLTQTAFIAGINAQPIQFEPGERYSYCNSGYYLLGMVIERLSGTTYASYIRDQFILPLGLTQTSYCGSDPGLPVPSGYYRAPGSVVPISPANMSLPFSSGAMCSTAPDLMRWTRALVSGQVMSEQSYQRMITPNPLAGGELTDYGYGLHIRTYRDRTMIVHTGGTRGFTTWLSYMPSEDLVVALLTNLTDPNGDIVGAPARRVMDAVLDQQ